MKVIDLLNKIANGEEVPKKIKYNGWFFVFDRQPQDYYCEEYGNLFEYLINEKRTSEFLNKEVEIIEEDKKIEKIDLFDNYTGYNWSNRKLCEQLERNFIELNSKINEIIDYINKEK